MRGLNLSKFKKISEDNHSATMVHEDGHQIKIAKGALPALQRKQLEKLPLHMADGGDPDQQIDLGSDTEGWKADNQGNLYKPGIGDKLSDYSNELAAAYGKNNPEAIVPSEPQAQATQSERMPSAAASESNPSDETPAAIPPTPTPNQVVDVPGAYAKGQGAIKEQQDIDTKLAQANAQTEQDDISARQNLLDGFQRNTQEFQAEQHKFMQDYANNKIDPKHYVESMNAAQKATTAIGLFLGGFGGGLTHQGNAALDYLNKQIDRDISAQEARLGQQKTLLGANQELYHDNVMAMNATRMQMNDIYNHQIQLNADKLGTPAAKAKADAASAKFAMDNAALLQQNAIRATALHSIGNGGVGLDALTLADSGLAPREEAAKEQQSLLAQKTAVDSTKNLFARMDKEQTTGNLLNPESSRRVAAMNSELVNTVMNASASKRLTRESIEAEIKPLEIKTTDNARTRLEKMNGVLNIIGKHADPTPYMAKYAPKALPQYPYQQPEIQTMGGVKYVRQGNYMVPVK